jgi:hypothetical protein
MPEDLQPDRRSRRHSQEKMERVAFRLKRDDDGYPPADWEHLWARPVGDSMFKLDNTPFFARGVSYGDIVLVELREGMHVFDRVVRPSGHSTLRVILFKPELVDDLRSQLRALGSQTELSHIPGLIAVDVPPSVDLARVKALLAAGEAAGDWEYEEAAVRRV